MHARRDVGRALGSVISRRLPLDGGLMSSATQMLTGGAFFLLVSLPRGEHLTAVPPVKALLSLGYLLHHTRPALAMSYAYVNPMVAVLLGVAFAGDSLSLGRLVAMGSILGSVVLITRARA